MMYLRRVRGRSMLPTLRPGQSVAFVYSKHARHGDIVLARLMKREVVKRIDKVVGSKVWLIGDNSLESEDSREYGPVTRGDIKGKLIWPRL